MAAPVQRALAWTAAVLGPVVLTALLLETGTRQRDYVFLYLGLVSVIAVASGLLTGLVASLISFFLVDFYFVPPLGTLNIANREDLANLALFLGTAGVVGVLASRLRQANRELLRLNREQAEAAELALRLARSEQQVQSLERTGRERSELLANVSHDLRTPIATILTESTRMLQSGEPVDARAGLQTIASEARRLSALVGDTLDVARIEGNALDLQLEPVEVGDAIESAAGRLSRRSPARKIEWDPHRAGVNVLADWDRLGQVFDNLLGNADRFAPAGTPIWITVEATGETITIRVIDGGPGVAPEVRDRIFQRFVTSSGSNGGSGGGTGLGLAIVHGIVEAHGGTVALESSGPEGTTFRFTLPRAGG